MGQLWVPAHQKGSARNGATVYERRTWDAHVDDDKVVWVAAQVRSVQRMVPEPQLDHIR